MRANLLWFCCFDVPMAVVVATFVVVMIFFRDSDSLPLMLGLLAAAVIGTALLGEWAAMKGERDSRPVEEMPQSLQGVSGRRLSL